MSRSIPLVGRVAPTLAVLLAAIAALAASPTAAQEAPDGRISGTVSAGTAGAELDGLTARLVVLEDAAVVGDEQTAVRDGRFAFTVPATVRRTYLVAIRYQGVQYITPPVVLSPDQPDTTVDLTLFDTTNEAPDLRILETIVTVVALDRSTGELWLQREDVVSLPGDRVFVGDESGVTLRIPAPEGAVEVEGGKLEGEVISISMPLRPGDRNAIVTTYAVRYDLATDEYRLRVTAPVRTDRIELRVPAGYVQRLEPLKGAPAGEAMELPELDDVSFEVVSLETLTEPGRGLLVDLVGLSGTQITHPLTEQPGSAIATVAALAVIAGSAVMRLRR